MKRVVPVLLAAVLIPGRGAAQLPGEESVWGPRVRVTPFVGQAPTVSRLERWSVFSQAIPASARFDVDLGAGPAAGAVLEVRMVDRFSFVAAGTYISRGRTREFSTAAGDVFDYPGSNFVIGRAGLAMRLREPVSELQFRRLSASVFAGPAYIRETPKNNPFADPAFQGSLGHWGANFGLEAELPLGPQALSLQAAIEDFVVFWNDAEIARRSDLAAARDGFITSTVIETDPSHMLLFRAGVSFRFR